MFRCQTLRTRSSLCRRTGIWHRHILMRKVYGHAIELWIRLYARSYNVWSQIRQWQNEAMCLSKPQVTVSPHGKGVGRRREVCRIWMYPFAVADRQPVSVSADIGKCVSESQVMDAHNLRMQIHMHLKFVLVGKLCSRRSVQKAKWTNSRRTVW